MISQTVFIQSFCKSQVLHKSVNVSLIITNIKNESIHLCEKRLLQIGSINPFCEVSVGGGSLTCSWLLAGDSAPRCTNKRLCGRALGVWGQHTHRCLSPHTPLHQQRWWRVFSWSVGDVPLGAWWRCSRAFGCLVKVLPRFRCEEGSTQRCLN